MSDNTSGKRSFIENLDVAGDQLVGTIKNLYDDASAKRVTIRNESGKELLTVPLTLGVAGGGLALLFAPMLTLVAAIGGAVAKLKLEVEREPED